MAKMVEITCLCGCGRTREVRAADRKRGWGLYYNKQCKARHQERKTGQYKAYLNRKAHRYEQEGYDEWCGPLSQEDMSACQEDV